MATSGNFNWNSSFGVGIDLGTTNSCVSVYKDGRITVLPDEDGNKLIPSVVAFETKRGVIKRLVGYDAIKNYYDTIYTKTIITEVKRLMGRKFDEPAVQINKQRWPFDVTANKFGDAQVNISLEETTKPGKVSEMVRRFTTQTTRQKSNELNLSPEDISSSILAKMKKMAEEHLGEEVTSVVITVPAHFNDAQRCATIEAAKLAKFDEIRIINEPSAAALAYGIKVKEKRSRKILIVDIGGGTSDVALIEIAGKEFKVLSSVGDNNIGGEDFDTSLFNYFLQQIESNDAFTDKDLLRIRSKCEQTKRKLSENPADPNWQQVLELDDLACGIDVVLTITRKKFEEINQGLFNKAIALIPACLRAAKMTSTDVDDIVVVGGSMRIPKLREMVQNEFQGRHLHNYMNPDEAIAVGASVLAAQNIGIYGSHVMLSDVTPFSLGIAVDEDDASDKMSVIIPRNTRISSCDAKRRYQTKYDYQTTLAINVYQGENEFVKDNMLLGKFDIEGLERALKGETKVDVTLKVNENGILEVTAKEVGADKENVVKRNLDSLLPHLNVFTRKKRISVL